MLQEPMLVIAARSSLDGIAVAAYVRFSMRLCRLGKRMTQKYGRWFGL